MIVISEPVSASKYAANQLAESASDIFCNCRLISAIAFFEIMFIVFSSFVGFSELSTANYSPSCATAG